MMKTMLAASSALVMLAGTALAQDAAAPQMTMEDAYAAAQNQLGVLEYCQTEGGVTDEVIDTQNRLLAMIPTPEDTAPALEAYGKGKEGTVASMGQETTLAEVATARSTTEEALCQQMAELVTQAAAQVPAAN
ncbi:pore-forming ESAT-6 family protein [Falsirhodobacter halotolerans]|uniref:pore-forming ESAT-6 family protein n=1 Tax=Falsirhodobacter halotolerans TaxID=1146892 RepID=UPI001FD4997B|nr:pore-forming ESAT-6 family protein [Falsirhodobacter halotolerans]MCJ8139431.1 pore-forming ESAT-6 family protein [Falsirhodobacter halotolerans]